MGPHYTQSCFSMWLLSYPLLFHFSNFFWYHMNRVLKLRTTQKEILISQEQQPIPIVPTIHEAEAEGLHWQRELGNIARLYWDLSGLGEEGRGKGREEERNVMPVTLLTPAPCSFYFLPTHFLQVISLICFWFILPDFHFWLQKQTHAYFLTFFFVCFVPVEAY